MEIEHRGRSILRRRPAALHHPRHVELRRGKQDVCDLKVVGMGRACPPGRRRVLDKAGAWPGSVTSNRSPMILIAEDRVFPEDRLIAGRVGQDPFVWPLS